MNECNNCKSTEIEKDLPILAKEHIGSSTPAIMGPYYLNGTKKFLGMLQTHVKHEPMYANLCKKCGNVQLFVKNADKDWDKEFPSGKHIVVWDN